METKEKKWESGPNQSHIDARVREQAERALKEAARQKENLDDKGEGHSPKNLGEEEDKDKENQKNDFSN